MAKQNVFETAKHQIFTSKVGAYHIGAFYSVTLKSYAQIFIEKHSSLF
jgi:hypothetical protein